MASEKIILASIKPNGDWFNLTDNNNREISVGTVDKNKKAVNQTLKTTLANAKVGDEIEMEIRDWNGKLYGNEPKKSFSGGGGKSWGEPKDQGAISALSCISSACSLYSLEKEKSPEKVLEAAEKFFAWVSSKSTLTKPSTEPKTN